MGLRFVFGRSGVGKTEYLRDYVIKSSLDNPDTNYIVMVPEQSNLMTQTEYVKAHPKGGILNVDILSFKRLSYKIFSETGGFHNKVLDESGKLMILKKVAEECNDRLKVLRKPMERTDSLDKLKSIFSEFSQYHIKSDSFDELIRNDNIPGLSAKLNDLMTLYDYYLNYISSDYITDEQVMDVLSEKIEVSEFVKNTVFVFDEYTGFTYLQNEVIRKLIRHSKDVIVAITMDVSYINETVVPEYNLFSLSVKTKTELTNMALEEKKKIHAPVILNERKKSSNNEFAFLEENLFAYSNDCYKDKTDRIIICESMRPEEEVYYLRNKIAELVREEGYSYKDIAVVTGDLCRYSILFERIMEAENIPYFVDDSKELLNNPFLVLVRSLLEIVTEDFSYSSVFRFLKSGLYRFSDEEICLLENYCIAADVRYFSSWNHTWDKLSRDTDNEKLAKLNEIREAIISDLAEFVYLMKKAKATVRERALALFTFIADINVEGKLLAISENFDAQGDYVHSVEYRQVYGAVVHLLDELVEIMGDNEISCEEFMNLLDAGFSAVKIGVLPPVNDYVILADVERSRISKTKVLFLLGANEGIIPKNNERVGFLNESERLAIKDSKIVLSPTSHEEYYTQKYYLYRILTKATDKLYISYCNYSDSEEVNPSYIVKNIEEKFPECIHVNTSRERENFRLCETKSDAYEYLIYSDEYKNDRWNAVYDYLSSCEDYKYRLKKIQEGLLYKGDKSMLGEKLAENLFLNSKRDLYVSVSRLETYAVCPFAHFLRYGIHIKDRVKPKMNAIDYGNIFHTALEDYVRILKQMRMTVSDVTDEAADAMAKECIINAYNQVYRSYNEPSSRDKYHIMRMIRMMRRTVWAMKKQFTDSKFTIRDVEYKFENNYAVELSNNRKVYLNGKIDRIDTYSDGLNEIIRVVDYKTGSTGFSMVKLYYGLQLQLIVYLDIVSDLEKAKNKSVVPAGAFYYNINDPIVDADKIKNGDIDSALLKELRLHGYQNKAVYAFSDKNTDEESLNLMMKHSRRKIKEISEALCSGDVSKSPYMMYDNGLRTGCDYCDYKQVCMFDASLPWYRCRQLDNIKDDAVLDKIKESEDASDELD